MKHTSEDAERTGYRFWQMYLLVPVDLKNTVAMIAFGLKNVILDVPSHTELISNAKKTILKESILCI